MEAGNGDKKRRRFDRGWAPSRAACVFLSVGRPFGDGTSVLNTEGFFHRGFWNHQGRTLSLGSLVECSEVRNEIFLKLISTSSTGLGSRSRGCI